MTAKYIAKNTINCDNPFNRISINEVPTISTANILKKAIKKLREIESLKNKTCHTDAEINKINDEQHWKDILHPKKNVNSDTDIYSDLQKTKEKQNKRHLDKLEKRKKKDALMRKKKKINDALKKEQYIKEQKRRYEKEEQEQKQKQKQKQKQYEKEKQKQYEKEKQKQYRRYFYEEHFYEEQSKINKKQKQKQKQYEKEKQKQYEKEKQKQYRRYFYEEHFYEEQSKINKKSDIYKEFITLYKQNNNYSKTFKLLALKYHPDKNSDKELANRNMIELNSINEQFSKYK
jgi:hypothetical protein